MESVSSYPDLLEKALKKEKSFLLLYKTGSEQSACAFQNLKNAVDGQQDINIYSANCSGRLDERN